MRSPLVSRPPADDAKPTFVRPARHLPARGLRSVFVIYSFPVYQSGTNPTDSVGGILVTNLYFRRGYLIAMICAIAPLSNARVAIRFSFSGGGITRFRDPLTIVQAPDNTSGVSHTNTFEITPALRGTFTDTNDGVSGSITGLYMPISYATALTAASAAFTGAGLSYDDLFFSGANSPD